MVVFTQKIKQILERRGFKYLDICKAVDVAPSTFNSWLSKNNLPIDMLDKLSQELMVSPAVFFETDFNTTQTDTSPTQHLEARRIQDRIKNLEQLLKEKERIIQLQDDKISLLENNLAKNGN